jgi:ethanolamine ammonia-lyase small subunit
MNSNIKKDTWNFLKKQTNARIALGRAGHSIPTQELLNFSMAHALAKDAIYKEMEIEKIQKILKYNCFQSYVVQSNVTHKKEYLMNPILGRQLHKKSFELLHNLNLNKGYVTIIFADGLSANAVNINALPLFIELIDIFKKTEFKLSPIIIAKNARVALGDEIGEALQSLATIMLIGERPGLSSPNSLGVYLTWNPLKGRNDSERNCISNIHLQGLSYKIAANKIHWLLNGANVLNASGVILKDECPNLNSELNNSTTLLDSTSK